MSDEFTIEEGGRGPSMVLRGAWRGEYADVVRRRGVVELVLNYALGWKGRDVEFLSQVDSLQGLSIIHRTIDDVSPIHVLRALRSLKVSTYCDTSIDFTQFPQLEECTLEWRAGAKSLLTPGH